MKLEVATFARHDELAPSTSKVAAPFQGLSMYFCYVLSGFTPGFQDCPKMILNACLVGKVGEAVQG